MSVKRVVAPASTNDGREEKKVRERERVGRRSGRIRTTASLVQPQETLIKNLLTRRPNIKLSTNFILMLTLTARSNKTKTLEVVSSA